MTSCVYVLLGAEWRMAAVFTLFWELFKMKNDVWFTSFCWELFTKTGHTCVLVMLGGSKTLDCLVWLGKRLASGYPWEGVCVVAWRTHS